MARLDTSFVIYKAVSYPHCVRNYKALCTYNIHSTVPRHSNHCILCAKIHPYDTHLGGVCCDWMLVDEGS